MKVATLTDHIFSPASRFRFRQYTPIFKNSGIEVHDFYRKFSTETAAPRDGGKRIRDSSSLIIKALLHESANIACRLFDTIKSNKYDVVWLSRQLIIGYPSYERLILKPLIYDIDDAIFLSSKLANLQFKISAMQADTIIAGNDFLADEASKYCRNIVVIPTAVDTQRWKPYKSIISNSDKDVSHFNIGWSGTSSSFKFFFSIEKTIRSFLLNYPLAKLTFMSDRFPKELKILGPHIEFIRWSEEDEVSFMQSLNVGLMPIGNDFMSKGKCAYKALLYAACGIPVIITPTGFNEKLLNQSNIGYGPKNSGEWYLALQDLYFDSSLRERLGNNGVNLISNYYSVDICAPKIISVLRQYV